LVHIPIRKAVNPVSVALASLILPDIVRIISALCWM